MSLMQALFGLGLYFLVVFVVGLIWVKRERSVAKRERKLRMYRGENIPLSKSEFDNHAEEHLTASW